MALNPSTAFTAKNDLPYKTPMYMVTFDAIPAVYLVDSDGDRLVDSSGDFLIVPGTGGDGIERFCTFPPVDPIAPVRNYVASISGGGFSLSPDEGTASSATLNVVLHDEGDYVTNMIHGATGNLQKKQCAIKAGFVGMEEADMLEVFTGLVVDYSYEDDGSWHFKISDTIRDLNKYVFRTATEDVPTEITGNPINILLSLLMSDQGDGANGQYDYQSPGIGMGIAQELIDIETFESIRDTYYPGTAITFRFTQHERVKGNDFFKNEFYKPLNMYPIIKGNGQYSATIYRPPLPPILPVTLDEDSMIGIPTYAGNLTSLINEVEFQYNYKDSPDVDYHNIDVYADADSINNRGVGDRTLVIKSQGLHTTEGTVSDFIDRSSRRIFNRYAVPPIKLNIKLQFTKLAFEAGDIIFVSNKFLPNLSTGNFDFENIPMEIIKRNVDWKRGVVSLTLLQTGYQSIDFCAISPVLDVVTGVSTTQFTVADVKDYEIGWFLTAWSHYENTVGGVTVKSRKHVEDGIEITDINTTTNTITTTTMATIPQADWVFTYDDTGTPLTDDQQVWGRIGAGYAITP